MPNGAVNPPGDLNPTLHNVSLSNPGLNVGTGATITAAALPVFTFGPTGVNANNYKEPVTYQYSLGVLEQSVGPNSNALSYVGSQNRHQNDLPEKYLAQCRSAACSCCIRWRWHQPGKQLRWLRRYPFVLRMKPAETITHCRLISTATSGTICSFNLVIPMPNRSIQPATVAAARTSPP